MKKQKLLRLISIGLFPIMLSSCQADSSIDAQQQSSAFPTTFTIEIPNSISRTTSLKNGSSEYITGQEVYDHLNNFINVGELATELVEDILIGISKYNLDHAMELSFYSDDDGKQKEITVTNQAVYDGNTWSNLVSIRDVESNEIALKVYWNTETLEGIAILRPKFTELQSEYDNTSYKVEYSQLGSSGYEKTMIVSIVNWEGMKLDRFHMDNMKMFVGKKGNIVDVYGNSNHPHAYLLVEENKGYNWAFVASAHTDLNIAIAEVGLPSSQIDSNDPKVLLKDNAMEQVFAEQIGQYYFNKFGSYPNKENIEVYLKNTEAPGYFNENGFIQAGEKPSADYSILESNIKALSPFNPKAIQELSILF